MTNQVARKVRIALATEGDYERLKRILDDPDNQRMQLTAGIHKVSRYYDDQNVLRDAGATLKMRKQLVVPADVINFSSFLGLLANPSDVPKSTVELTLGQKIATPCEGQKENNEWTVPLNELWDTYAEGLNSAVSGWFPNLPAATWQLLDGRTFQKWGELETARRVYDSESMRLMCLDRTCMLNEVDYGLVVRARVDELKTVKDFVRWFLNDYGIDWAWQDESKEERLRRRLDARTTTAP